MTAATVVLVLHLLAGNYGAHPQTMECLSWHESRHVTTAVNGDYVGVLQLGSAWWAEFVPQYLADETAPHREYVRTHGREDPLAQMIVATWAVAHGHGSRWSANRFCWDIDKRG